MRHSTTGTRRYLVLAALLMLGGCSGAPAPADEATPAQETAPEPEAAPPPYVVYVTNEGSGDLTVIRGDTHEVSATIPLGKRPRGIKVGPDGAQLFVALSGSPPAPPGVDEDTLPPPDRTEDGVGIVDIAEQRVVNVLRAGTDPEQIAVSADGTRVFVANEDAALASIVDIASGEVVAQLPVGGEPEGVTLSPDGRWVYVTSENDSQVTVIDAVALEVVTVFDVGARPRSSSFSPDSARAYVTAENGGTVSVVDTSTHTVTDTIQLTGETVRPMGIVVSPDGGACLRLDRPGPSHHGHRHRQPRSRRLGRGRHQTLGHSAHVGRPLPVRRQRPVQRRVGGGHRVAGSHRHGLGWRASLGRRDRRELDGRRASKPDVARIFRPVTALRTGPHGLVRRTPCVSYKEPVPCLFCW